MTCIEHRPGYRHALRQAYIVASGLLALSLFAATALAQGLQLTISAESERFAPAVTEYKSIWEAEGTRIVAAVERTTGLKFEAGPIGVVVYEGPSYSGFRDKPMQLRASYPGDTKRATLVHELSHRLISELVPATYDDHPIIFLFLYDVWVDLWGKTFADEQVKVESARSFVNYAAIWRSVLPLTPAERAAKWREWLADRKAGKPLKETVVH